MIEFPDTVELPVAFQQFLFRSIRELLVNVYKHSNATHVTIRLDHTRSTIQLSFSDNGNGEYVVSEFHDQSPQGFGLFSIYQNTNALDGKMVLSDNMDNGVSIFLNFPTEATMKSFG